jgi:excisionase family DNA binding protein
LIEAYLNIYKAYMLKTKEAARLLRVHTNTLRRWSDKGIIRSYRFDLSGERRFKFADILKFLMRTGDQPARLELGKPSSNVLTITEVADILHASENTIRHWADEGSLKCYRIGPRGDRRFDSRVVKDFAEQMGYPKEDIERLQNVINRN